MISLSTLKTATRQQVFDQVAVHLVTQGKRSINPLGRGCVYRGKDGTKCAAGALISDEEFETKGMMFNNGMDWCGLSQIYEFDSGESYGLILALQEIHDGYEPEEWKDLLIGLAVDENLRTDSIRNMPVAA